MNGTTFTVFVVSAGWILNLAFLAERFTTLAAVDYIQLLSILGVLGFPLGAVMGWVQLVGL